MTPATSLPQTQHPQLHLANTKRILEASEWFHLLQQLSRDINLSNKDITATFDDLFAKLIDELAIDALAIWTIEPGTEFMQISYSSRLSERYLRFFNKTDRIKVGQGLVGRVISDRKTKYVHSVGEYQEIGIERWNNMLKEEGVDGILATPMFLGEALIGVLTFYYKRPHHFSEFELLFAEVLANQIAIILKNHENLEQLIVESSEQQHQIERLVRMQHVIEILNLHLYESIETFLPYIFEYVHQEFGGTGVMIFRPSSKGKLLEPSASYGVSREYLAYLRASSVPIGTGTLAGVAFETREVAYTERTLTDSRISRDHSVHLSQEKVVSIIALPLLVQERISGVLCIHYDRMHQFVDQELSVLQTFAQFISVALDNMRIFNSLSLEKERTASIVHSLQDGIVVYQLDGKIIEINRAAEELLHISRADIMSEHPRYLPPETTASLTTLQAAVIPDFETQEITLPNPEKTVLRVTQVPLWDEYHRKTGHMRILHDITIERSVEMLKSSFVSTASHQLRTPLTGIKWGIAALKQNTGPSLNQDAHTLIERLESSTDHMLQLINDLLNVSRIEEGATVSIGEIDLVALLADLVHDLRFDAEHKKLTFDTSITKELPLLKGDIDRLRIAIRNLLENAIKYTPEGGKVMLGAAVAGDHVEITISDTGIGIDKDALPFLFNKFYRAPNAVRQQTEGTGLGLYLCKTIISQHGGTVSVDSAPNEGTTFTIRLPLPRE